MLSYQGSTTFSLSFNGIEFCLEPNVIAGHAEADVLSIAKVCSNEVIIHLKNFAGTLHVKSNNIKTSLESSNNALPSSKQPIQTEIYSSVENDVLSLKNNDTEQLISDPETVPDPVPEDVPSPKPESHNQNEYYKKQRGQQKLNFFGTNVCSTENSNFEKKRVNKNFNTSIKRSFTNNLSQNIEKKSRMNICSLNEDSIRHDTRTTKFTLASLGQTVQSQETAYSLDEDVEKRWNNENIEDIGKANNELWEIMNEEEVSKINVKSADNKNLEETSDVSRESVYDQINFSLSMDSLSRSSIDLTLENKIASSEANHYDDNKSVSHSVSLSPCPRWGQSMTMIDHRRLIMYGGQTVDSVTQSPKFLADLYVYDLLENKWTKPINCDGVARTWHSANFLPSRQLLLCFGGDIVDEKNGKTTTTDQVMVFDTEILLWYPPTVSGQSPSRRSGHTASLLHKTNELVVFGGVKNGKWLNSTYILDTNRWRWLVPKIFGNAPPPRSYHSATAIRDWYPSDEQVNERRSRIVIFGGNNDTNCFNSVHVLEQRKETISWSHPKVSGKAPTPRTGHTATLLDDGYTIMIYGGWDPNTEDENGDDLIFGDSFLLDTKLWTWSAGVKPQYASFNSTTVPNGGVNRVGHSALLVPGSEKTQLLAFGGRLPDGFASDFQCFSLPSH